MYCQFVLSTDLNFPTHSQTQGPLSAKQGDDRWRRVLWENCYPRVRHETDPMNAAKIVVRFLRERITVIPGKASDEEITTIWERGMTDRGGFCGVYAAALRSIGIPARLDEKRNVEVFTDQRWQKAPKPIILDFVPANDESPQ
jgi:hypothetical protein